MRPSMPALALALLVSGCSCPTSRCPTTINEVNADRCTLVDVDPSSPSVTLTCVDQKGGVVETAHIPRAEAVRLGLVK